jgi:hypothetical protein
MSWILYPHFEVYSQNLEHEEAKMVLKGSSVGLYHADLRQTVKGPGEVVDQGWVRYLVSHQKEPCNLDERLKNKLSYQDLISASQCIEVLISDPSTLEEVRWLSRKG